jgi:carboxyl-terminal processing protease
MRRVEEALRFLVIVVVTACVVAGSFLAGYAAHWAERLQAGTPAVSTQPEEDEAEGFRVFWQGWHLLQEDYYGDLPQMQDAARSALKGVVQSLGDPYTVVVDPKYAAILREDMTGSFEGIGAVVRMNEAGRLEIVEVFEKQPAAEAGLRRGDLILQVDDTPIENMNVMEAVALIRGPEGTSVRLLVQRGKGDPFSVTLVRRKIEIPSVQTRVLERTVDGQEHLIGYIRLTDFNAAVPRQFGAALRALLSYQPDGLILDLRGNPGGYLHVAVEVASQFVGEGAIVTERRKGGEARTFTAIPGGLATNPDLPLAVLVNMASASASEIVAGAVQDSGRGVLVGETTFGKGSVQLAYTLDDGSELRITTARWFTPGGREIHGQGLEPDIPVEEPEEAEVDAPLEAAVAYILEKASGR